MALGRSDKEFMIRVKADIQDAVQNMRQMEQSLDRQGTAAGKLKGTFAALGPAIGAFISAQTVRAVVDTTLAFEKLEAKLRFATGSTQGAAREMAFLRETSQKLGLDLLSTGDAYSSIAAAAKNTALEGEATREIFTAVAEASRVMGLSADDTTGALRALEQMISKGTVQAEELRGQLGERIPGAFQIAARAMGVTTEELDEMLRSGEVLAEDLLPKLAAELRKTVAPEVANAADSSAAAFARMGTAVDELANAIGSSGLVDALAEIAEWLASVASTAGEAISEIQRAARAVAALQVGSLGKLQELDQAIADTEALLDASVLSRTRFFTNTGDFVRTFSREEIEAKLKELKAEREALAKELGIADRLTTPPEGGGGSQDGKKCPPCKDDARPPQRAPNEDAVRALEFEAETYGKTAKEIALYRLQLQGATKDQLARAAAAIDAVEAEEQFAEALEQIEQAEADAQQEAAAHNAELDAQAQYWRDLINPANEYQRQIEQIEELYARGKISVETYQEATLHVLDAFDSIGEKAQETSKEVDQFTIQAARNIQSTLGDTLYNAMKGNFDNIEDAFLDMLQRMVAEALAANINGALFGDYDKTGKVGGIAGGALNWLSSLVMHTGGVVGQGGPTRQISPLAAAMAPRYHAGGIIGLAPRERVGVLEVGEEVLTRNDPRHVLNGGGKKEVTVNVTMNLPNVQDRHTFERDKPSILRELGRAIRKAESEV